MPAGFLTLGCREPRTLYKDLIISCKNRGHDSGGRKFRRGCVRVESQDVLVGGPLLITRMAPFWTVLGHLYSGSMHVDACLCMFVQEFVIAHACVYQQYRLSVVEHRKVAL